MRAWKQIRSTVRKPKRPITVSLLVILRECLTLDTLEGCCMWAILCVGVHGCFRSAELLEPALEWRQITSHEKENRLTINLEQSKTDPFREEVDRFVFATCDDTCPIAALRKLTGMQRARGSHTAVFAKQNGRPTWTRRQFVDRLKELVAKAGVKHPDLNLCSKEYAGHSMRRGGATSLAYRGIPTGLI